MGSGNAFWIFTISFRPTSLTLFNTLDSKTNCYSEIGNTFFGMDRRLEYVSRGRNLPTALIRTQKSLTVTHFVMFLIFLLEMENIKAQLHWTFSKNCHRNHQIVETKKATTHQQKTNDKRRRLPSITDSSKNTYDWRALEISENTFYYHSSRKLTLKCICMGNNQFHYYKQRQGKRCVILLWYF